MLVSLIVPVRRDSAALEALLDQLPDQPSGRLRREVIVVAAGPRDAELQQVQERRPDVAWLYSAEGRGPQLNTGAGHALGEWLWFVHADSTLPAGWLAAFEELAGSDVVGGSFAFALQSAAWQARLLERAVALRVRWFGLPYGDQGIFVRRSVFQRIGGFASQPLLEDVEFIQRLKRQGPLRHLTLKLGTSARRWEQEGWWRRSAANLLILGLFRLGVSPGWLARRYYRDKGTASS